MLTYQKQRTADKMVVWIKKKTDEPSIEIKSFDHLEILLKENLDMIGLFLCTKFFSLFW